MSKPPPYNIPKPSATLDVNTLTKPSVTHKAKVLYDFDATEDDELSLLADEVGRETWVRVKFACDSYRCGLRVVCYLEWVSEYPIVSQYASS